MGQEVSLIFSQVLVDSFANALRFNWLWDILRGVIQENSHAISEYFQLLFLHIQLLNFLFQIVIFLYQNLVQFSYFIQIDRLLMNNLVLGIKLLNESIQRLCYDFFEGLARYFLTLLFPDFSENFLQIGLEWRYFDCRFEEISLRFTYHLVRWCSSCIFFFYGLQTGVVCK